VKLAVPRFPVVVPELIPELVPDVSAVEYSYPSRTLLKVPTGMLALVPTMLAVEWVPFEVLPCV